MSVNSAAFLLFLAVSAAVYYLIPRKRRWLVLLAASAFFYLSHGTGAAVCLLLTVFMTWGAGLWLGALHGRESDALSAPDAVDKKAIRKAFKQKRRAVLTAALLLNFASLALFKYLDAWTADLGALFSLFGRENTFRPLGLLLPLGISFYTFQTSGYLIDAYRGRVTPEKNPARYALFACWFPQMIQGPINRWDRLAPQLTEGANFDSENVKAGIQLMLWGMLRKVFVADPLSAAVSAIYGDYTSFTGATVFFGAALYCLQLYCDFAGGTDLVRGASLLFGIRMDENFRRPYFARTLDEFWRRWHISLGEWMKDYLFYPLALSAPFGRIGKAARQKFGPYVGKLIVPALSTLTVFLAVGVWQGPGLANLAYGLWNGGLMSLSMLCEKPFGEMRRRLKLSEEKRWFRVVQILRTCFLVVIGRYFSRSAWLYDALRMLWRTVRYFAGPGMGFTALAAYGLTPGVWVQILFGCSVMFAVGVIQEKGRSPRELLDRTPVIVQFLLLFAAVTLLLAAAYLNTDYTAIAYVYENI